MTNKFFVKSFRSAGLVLALLLSLSLLFSACSKPAEPSGPEIDPEREKGKKVYYESVHSAIDGLAKKSSGTITVEEIFKVEERDSVEKREYPPFERRKTDILNFKKVGRDSEYVEIVMAGSGAEEGYLREGGVVTNFIKQFAEDGRAYRWRQMAATSGDTAIPENYMPFFELEPPEAFENITLTTEGDLFRYSFVYTADHLNSVRADDEFIKEAYLLVSQRKDIYLDSKGRIVRIELEKEEEYIVGVLDSKAHYLYDMVFQESDEGPDLMYFEKDGTYVRPLYEPTETKIEKVINVPDTMLLDIRLPRMKDSYPGADDVNMKIGADFGEFAAYTEDDLVAMADGTYPALYMDYKVYDLGDIWEICIFSDYFSAWGSGGMEAVERYCYDKNAGIMLDEDEFLERMGESRDSIVGKFYTESPDMERENLTYENLRYNFYFDEYGTLILMNTLGI